MTSILDGTGETVERHSVVVEIQGTVEGGRVPPELSEALEARVVRALAARLRRTRRLVAAAADRLMASERAIALHLHQRRRPEDGQLDLFNRRRSARHIDRDLLDRALSEDETRARLAREESRADLSIARPELVWIWTVRK